METAAEKKERLDIEASRTKRLERVKAKHRDRGGIYKPAETNPLLDILLARDVSGRSPSRARRKSGTAAAGERRQRGANAKPKLGPRATAARKSGAAAAAPAQPRRKSVAPSRKPKIVAEEDGDGGAGSADEAAGNEPATKHPTASVSVAGPSSVPAPSTGKRRREVVEDEDAGGDADLPSPPKRPKASSASVPAKPKPKPRTSRKLTAATRKGTGKGKGKEKIQEDSVDDDKNEPGDDNAEGGDDEEPTVSKSISKPKRAAAVKTNPTAAKRAGRKKKAAVSEDDGEEENKAEASTTATKRSGRRKTVIPEVDKEEDEIDKNRGKGRGKGKGKGKMKAEPVPETRRAQFPKPNLDTVFEGESEIEEEVEKVEPETIRPAEGLAISVHTNLIFAVEQIVPISNKSSAKDSRKRKLENSAADLDAPDSISGAESENDHTSVPKRLKSSSGAGTSKSTKREVAMREDEEEGTRGSSSSKRKTTSSATSKTKKAKAKALAAEADTAEEPIVDASGPSAKAKSKPESPSSSNPPNLIEENKENSKVSRGRGAKSFKGTKAKPAAAKAKPAAAKAKPAAAKKRTTVKSTSKAGTKPTWAAAAKSKFANLPTMHMDSPLKVLDSERDEIDFLP
ncbi:hypothetical protein DFH11DRAFT_1788232 [Phellopilus nigrolimitatus]|nr:hypothetical protein DFH11DRAFT_1788232 [Phellopilus nigrolimitatus]